MGMEDLNQPLRMRGLLSWKSGQEVYCCPAQSARRSHDSTIVTSISLTQRPDSTRPTSQPAIVYDSADKRAFLDEMLPQAEVLKTIPRALIPPYLRAARSRPHHLLVRIDGRATLYRNKKYSELTAGDPNHQRAASKSWA